MYFLETSAKASDNVERLFTEIAHELLQVGRTILVWCSLKVPSIILDTFAWSFAVVTVAQSVKRPSKGLSKRYTYPTWVCFQTEAQA